MAVQPAGSDTSGLHRADWFSLYVSDDNTYTPRTAEDPQDTMCRSVIKPTEGDRLEDVRVKPRSLFRSSESKQLVTTVA